MLKDLIHLKVETALALLIEDLLVFNEIQFIYLKVL